jgi:hypothetical protein
MKKHSRTARSSKNAASPNARPAKKAISSSQPVIPWLVPPRTGKGSSISGEMTSGKRWLVALIKKLLDIAWDMWQYRNSVVHNQEIDSRDADTRRQIEDLFARGPVGLPKEAKALFRQGSRQILQARPEVRQAWVIRVTAAFERAQRKAKQDKASYAQERGTMAKWLGSR